MRKALLVLGVALCALSWIGRSGAAYAGTQFTTIGCQGHDLLLIFEIPAIVEDTAVWSVTTNGWKFVGGTLFATYNYEYPNYTCEYELDTTHSSFSSYNGIVEQDLFWSSADCYDQFEDYVYLINNGTEAVMNDVDLDGDGVAGSGTCVLQSTGH